MPDLGRVIASDGLCMSSPWLPPEVWTSKVGKEDLNGEEMNHVVIEEHQAGDLVFAQVYYLYILLEATLAYVIIPIAIVLRTKYSSYQ